MPKSLRYRCVIMPQIAALEKSIDLVALLANVTL
jgi:hypothetical protein